MNLDNIKVGDVFKNFKDLCKALDEEYPIGGSNTKGRKEKFGIYFNWVKTKPKGNEIKITEIYSVPKEKIDNRGKSSNSRNQNNKYMKYIDPILKDIFSKLFTNKNNIRIFGTITSLAEKAGVINSNYKTVRENLIAFANFLKENGNGGNLSALNNILTDIRNTINPMISSSLERLKNEGIIDYKSSYIIQERSLQVKIEPRLATDREISIIKACELEAMEEFQINNKSKLETNNQRKREYYAYENKLVYDKIPNMQFHYYKGFEIIVKKQLGDINANDYKIELNKVVRQSIEERNIEKKEKLEKSIEENAFGEPELNNYEKEVLRADYVPDSGIILNYLLDLNSQKLELMYRMKGEKSFLIFKLSSIKVEPSKIKQIVVREEGLNSKHNIKYIPIEEIEVEEIKVNLDTVEEKLKDNDKWAFDESYKYDVTTGKLKEEYQPKPWKFEPKYQWQRTEFAGYTPTDEDKDKENNIKGETSNRIDTEEDFKITNLFKVSSLESSLNHGEITYLNDCYDNGSIEIEKYEMVYVKHLSMELQEFSLPVENSELYKTLSKCIKNNTDDVTALYYIYERVRRSCPNAQIDINTSIKTHGGNSNVALSIEDIEPLNIVINTTAQSGRDFFNLCANKHLDILIIYHNNESLGVYKVIRTEEFYRNLEPR